MEKFVIYKGPALLGVTEEVVGSIRGIDGVQTFDMARDNFGNRVAVLHVTGDLNRCVDAIVQARNKLPAKLEPNLHGTVYTAEGAE